jgi:hypothetical protein
MEEILEEWLQATIRAPCPTAAAGDPEPVPVLHPNLPALYRRWVEALEGALIDPESAGAATEALHTLVNAMLVFPCERRREVSVTRRGDLAALLRADAAVLQSAPGNKKAVNLLGWWLGGLGCGEVHLGDASQG